jgi:hypothetical protein
MLSCDLCGLVEDEDQAIEDGWVPYFWVTETVLRDSPVCPSRARKHLEDFDEEPMLKPGHLIALGRSSTRRQA